MLKKDSVLFRLESIFPTILDYLSILEGLSQAVRMTRNGIAIFISLINKRIATNLLWIFLESSARS